MKDRNTDRRTNYGTTEGVREEVGHTADALHLKFVHTLNKYSSDGAIGAQRAPTADEQSNL